MTSVLDRDALEGSPLADLHEIANQLGVEGFRRLRKSDLVDAILASQGVIAAPAKDDATDEDAAESEAPKPRRRRSRARKGDEETVAAVEAADRADEEEESDPEPRRGRGRRRGGAAATASADKPTADKVADETIDGVVELQPNGSGFVRPSHPEISDDDVYVSAAQVKRCELVSGDRVAGPVRPPRRSERFPSLIRIDTINGKPADEVASKEGTRFEELKAAFPTERLELDSADATVNAVQWLTPFGKGSRVVVSGPPLSGKSDLLRRVVGALPKEGVEVTVALAGVRPEEAGEWGADVVGVWLGASADAQAQVVEQAVELGRRVAARGGDAVVVIDALDGLPPQAARRALAAARNLVDGGSLTVIAAASAPFGGETTLIALDGALTGQRRFPNLDLATSGSMRPELLVGDEGADKIAAARAEARAASA
ncbi:MAG: Rho termination factor N-terminal domain-containing protein [Solirubrobacteraceae bacterium]